MKLRPYQLAAHTATINYLTQSSTQPPPGIVVMPTGCGKTFQIASLINEYEGKVLVICPSQEILTQNYEKFIEIGGEASIYSASLNSKEVGHVTFATLASIKSMGVEFKKLGVTLLITDECHLGSNPKEGMFKRFIKALSPRFVIGYTATPFRLAQVADPNGYSSSQLQMMNRTSPKFYPNIIHVYQIPHAVKSGYWAEIELDLKKFNKEILKLNSTGSEFSEESIQEHNRVENINNKIYIDIKNLIKQGKKSVLVFLDSVENCYKMKGALGGMCEVVSANTNKKERVSIIERFKSGNIKVVCCVSTLTTGFDFPELECVIMGRPTNSLALFYQIYGRVVRPFNNKKGLFIDYGGNIERFGRMEDITIENFDSYGWGIFSKERLLSGVPMGGSDITKGHLTKMKNASLRADKLTSTHKMTFGKYKGKYLSEMSIWYCKWLLTEAWDRLDDQTRLFVTDKIKKSTL